jgi:small subunit ribosomal protein S14
VAQLVAHLRCMQRVTSSNLVISTRRSLIKRSKRLRRRKKMLKKRRKDRKRRERVERHWKERIQRKRIAKDQRRPKEEREEAEKKLRLEGSNRNQSITRVRNRCVDTGNPRFVIRWFRRSGLQVRERALVGKLPGVYKISW